MSTNKTRKVLKKKKVVKNVTPSPSKPVERTPKKEPRDLFEYEGHLYAEGAIVQIGYGPYLAKKKKQYRKKTKKSVIPNNIPEEPFQDEGNEEDRDEDENIWQGEYGAERPDQNDEGSDIGSGEDIEEIRTPKKKPKQKRKKAIRERDIIFGEKEVEVLEGEAKAIAQEMGLDYKKWKWVEEPVEYKVVEHDLRYMGYDKFVVTREKGKLVLKPYSPPRADKISVFDADVLPPPVPLYVAMPHVEKPEPPEEYEGPLRLGDRVTFTLVNSNEKEMEGILLRVTDSDFTILDPRDQKIHRNIAYQNAQNLRFKPVPEEYIKKGKIYVNGKYHKIDTDVIVSKGNLLAKQASKAPFRYAEFDMNQPKVEYLEGVITDYAESGFVVNVLEKGVMTGSVEVSYENDTIKKVEKRKRISDVMSGKANVAEDYLKASIETSTRIDAMKSLFRILTDVLGDVYDSPIDSDERLVEAGKLVDWKLANSVLIPSHDYYVKQLHEYIISIKFSETLENSPDFSEEAFEEYEASIDPILIVEGLVHTFGDIFDGSAARCLTMISSRAKDEDFRATVIDIAIRRDLNKISNEELEEISGIRLARIISHIISATMESHPPPNPILIEYRMKRDWAISTIESHVPTKKEIDEFDRKYKKDLKERYNAYQKSWEDAKKAKKRYKELKKIVEKEYDDLHAIQRNVPRLRSLTVDGRYLSMKGIQLADDCAMLEEQIYIETSTLTEGNNQQYLRAMCRLMQFLSTDTTIGKYANFFRSKIRSGMYDVYRLDAATHFHMLPEFFTNTDMTDEVFYRGIKEIDITVDADVIDFIDIYVLGNAPRIRNTAFGERFLWEDYVKDPSESCGGMRMKVGANYRGIEDVDNYDCVEGDDKTYTCKAKLEPITDDDLVLCYDEKLRRFTCASINDVLYALWDEDQGNEPINPMTDKPYGDAFLQRMRNRYEDLYDSKASTFTKRVIKFKTTEDRLLFGEGSEEEIIY